MSPYSKLKDQTIDRYQSTLSKEFVMHKYFCFLLLTALLISSPSHAQQDTDYIGTWKYKTLSVKISRFGKHLLLSYPGGLGGEEVYPLIQKDGMYAVFRKGGEERVLRIVSEEYKGDYLLFSGMMLSRDTQQ